MLTSNLSLDEVYRELEWQTRGVDIPMIDALLLRVIEVENHCEGADALIEELQELLLEAVALFREFKHLVPEVNKFIDTVENSGKL